MSKIFTGIGAAAAVIAVGGYYGTQAYIQHHIANEIEANFAHIRAAGGQASHGDLSFDLWHRTVGIADLSVVSAAPNPATVKIGRFAASGIGLGSASTFSADNIVLTDIEAHGATAPSGGIDIAVKAPRIEVADYAGPTRMPMPAGSGSQLDLYRTGLAQFALIAARAITAPSLTVTAKGAGLQGSADYVYSDLAIRDIKDGKVASSGAARANVAMTTMQDGKPVRTTGEIIDLTARDIDTTAAATVLDPAHANDEKFYRIQGPVSVGAYTLISDNGSSFRMDGIRIGDMKIQPSKFRMQELLAVLAPAGASADPARMRLIIETVASTYEGVQIDNSEMRGLSIKTPQQSAVKIASTRFNLDRGKIGEFAVEGVDAPSKDGPVKIGRFALKGLDFSGLMRQSAQMGASGATPSADSVIALLKGLEGIEIKDLAAPYKDTRKPVMVHDASLSWGEFVGPFPSKAHLILNMTGPLEEKDREPFTLLRDVGINEATADIDIGLAWNESEKKLVLTPGRFEIGKLAALTAEVSLDNVTRELFTTKPQQAILAVAQIKPSPLKITLHDLGAVDLSIAQQARKAGTTPDAVRNSIVDGIENRSQAVMAKVPNADKIGAAVAAFIKQPNRTITISIAPKQDMRLLELADQVKASGPEAMSLFDVDAKTE